MAGKIKLDGTQFLEKVNNEFKITNSELKLKSTGNTIVDSSGNAVVSESGGNVTLGNVRLPATGGIKDSAGNNVLSESSGVVTLSNISIGSITDKLGSLSNPYTNIDTLRTNLYSTKSNGDIDYLYFSDGRDTIQLYVFWLTVNSQMNAYVLVGGGNDGSDATSYSRYSTIGAYPKGFPLGANDTSADNRVFGNFHIGFNFVATLAQASADYIAGIDAFGNFGTTYINNSSWWDNVKNQVCDDASVTNVASSGNFYKGTFSQSSNITASDTGKITETNSASEVVGKWDTHYYYSNPGNHVNADGVWFGDVSSSTTGTAGKDGLIFIR